MSPGYLLNFLIVLGLDNFIISIFSTFNFHWNFKFFKHEFSMISGFFFEEIFISPILNV